MSAKWETSPWRARRSVSLRLTCISHHVGKRSAEQGRQDEVRTALAGNTALGVFHETRLFFRNTSFTAPSVRRGCAVRRKSGIEGGRTKKPKSDAHPAVPAITSRLACPPLDAIGWLFCCPVTASPAAVSHYSPLFPVISRGLGGLGGAPEEVFKRRSLEIPEKCTKSRFSQENA